MRFEFDGSEGSVSVRVWEHPGARRLVVIAHGYGEHIERYDHVARALRARGAAVYGPDHLGHGRSAGERVVIADVEHVVDDVVRVVERAQAACPGLPVVLLGHSMGGLIATRLAQRAERRRLAGLVLSGPAIGLGPALAQMIDAGLADQPLDVTALSRDAAVGEAYAATRSSGTGPGNGRPSPPWGAHRRPSTAGRASPTYRCSGSTAAKTPWSPSGSCVRRSSGCAARTSPRTSMRGAATKPSTRSTGSGRSTSCARSSSAWRERHVGCAAPAREGEHQRTRDLGTHIRPARCRSSVARWRRPTAPGDDATAGSVTVLTFTPRGVSLGTVPSLADAFRVLNELEAEGIVARYAVGV